MEKHRYALLSILLLSFFLNTWGITWGLPNVYSWSADDISPHGILWFLYERFCTLSQYPPAHYIINSILYGPYLIYIGIMYRETVFSNLYVHLSNLMLISRGLSAIMGVITVYMIYLTALKLYKNYSAALFSSAIMAFSYIFVLFSHLGNVDIPFLFWFSVSFYLFVRILEKDDKGDYLKFGLSSALSLSTKDAVLTLYLGVLLALIYFKTKHILDYRRIPHAIDVIKKHLHEHSYAIFVFFFVYLILNNFFFCPENLEYRIRILFFDTKNLEIYAPRDINTGAFIISFVGVLSSCVGMPFFVVIVLGLFYTTHKSFEKNIIFLAPILSYVIFPLLLTNRPWPRYLIPVIYLLAFPAGDFLRKISATRIGGSNLIPGIVIGLILTYSFLYASVNDVLMNNDTRYHAERWVHTNVKPEEKIAVIDSPEFSGRYEYYNRTVVFKGPRITADNRDIVLKSDYIIISDNTYGNTCYKVLEDTCNYSKKELENLIRGDSGYKIAAEFKIEDTINKNIIKILYPADLHNLPDGRVSPTIKIFKKDSSQD